MKLQTRTPAATETPTVAVRPVNPLDDASWDSRIARSPDASFFHSSSWARVLNGTYGFRPIYLVAEGADDERSVLPLMEVDSWLTGRRGISLPFTDECQALGANERTLRALAKTAMSCAQLRRWRYLELRGGRNWMGRVPVSARFHGHTLDLHEDVNRLFAGCDSAVRRAVRKAAGSDLQIEFRRSIEAARSFHGLLCQTRQRHGVPPQPFAFFEHFHRHVLAANHGWVILATLRGRPVAGAVFVQFGRTALYKYGASDEAFQELRPNNLVMWRAIEWYARAGFTSLDFGRTSLDNEGLRRFKLAWGTRERAIEYVRYNRHSHDFATFKPDSAGWKQRMLKKLPQPLLRLIGAAAYRHVA